MAGILKTIFTPHDGSRKRVREEVSTSRREVEKAANRFEETVKDLLKRNDTITGRTHVLRHPSS